MHYFNRVVRITAFVLVVPLGIQAQPEITRYTIDGGGGTSQGGSTAISGTIGQPDPGLLSGGGYELRGGFWAGGAGPAATPTPVQTGLDVRPIPLDKFIDALDMIEWVSRVKNSGATPEVFFDLSNHWIRNYP